MFATIWNFITTHWVGLSVGALSVTALGWVMRFLDTKGAQYAHDELEKLRAKSNSNSVLGQIAADDAVISILEDSIPLVLNDLDTATQQAIAGGSITAVDWKQFGSNLWDVAKFHVEGGINDYLAHSSYDDGKTIAELIAKRFFVTQKMQQAGLVVDPPRSGDVANVGPVVSSTATPVVLAVQAPANQ